MHVSERTVQQTVIKYLMHCEANERDINFAGNLQHIDYTGCY